MTKIKQLMLEHCDFAFIKDPEMKPCMLYRFVWSVGNEAVLKALFKDKDDELTFKKVVDVAIETKDTAKAAKETRTHVKYTHF